MAAGWKDALMADTGAPWNIPYVEPADLVRDYPAADEAQALAIAAGLTTRKFGQIVQTVKTDVFSTTSTSFTTVTGLTASITPTATSSRVLIVVQIAGSAGANTSLLYRLSGGNSATYVGDTAGSRLRAIAEFSERGTNFDAQHILMSGAAIYLDSPNTTSATTYGVEVRVSRNGASSSINGTGNTTDSNAYTRGASSITVIEVSG